MIQGLPREVDSECLDVRPAPAVFLRFEAPRVRVALPYASLLMLELALNEEQLELVFATHRVTVRGRKLARIYQTISEGAATQVSAATRPLPTDVKLMPVTSWVTEIRIEPVENNERSSR